jgi:hypothetical protein
MHNGLWMYPNISPDFTAIFRDLEILISQPFL